MGLKTDTSFLRFLTMGAVGVLQTMNQLRMLGFEPIELERYCTSNKLWLTKVKRLRLPDVLCVRTGLRLEVRAKTDLRIRMSDAPTNPDRRWDTGLRDDDVVAFIAFLGDESAPSCAEEAVFFRVGELRASAERSTLGPPKSASEGAERDRTWPAVIPSRSGVVQSVTPDKLVVEMKGDGNPTRRQTYQLAGKNPYVKVGDPFLAEVSILAGAPSQLADLPSYLKRVYDPLIDLRASEAGDRYAAVKALRYREDLRARAVPALEQLLSSGREERVALEAAGSAAALGSDLGQERLVMVFGEGGRQDLRMETVFILTELGTTFAKTVLLALANKTDFGDDELRQASVWGLGKAGLKAYDELISFIDDPAENVALHAIVGFGNDAPESIIQSLVARLDGSNVRRAAAASEVLRIIGNEVVVRRLVEAASTNDWALATLGRLPPRLTRPALEGTDLLNRLAPMMLLSEGANWLANQDRVTDIAFLGKQNL